MWPSTQLIGKDIRTSSQLFTRRVADVISEACFTAMTGDRHDEIFLCALSEKKKQKQENGKRSPYETSRAIHSESCLFLALFVRL